MLLPDEWGGSSIGPAYSGHPMWAHRIIKTSEMTVTEKQSVLGNSRLGIVAKSYVARELSLRTELYWL